MKDYHQILGVSYNCTAEEVRKAYRTLAKKYHPDINHRSDASLRFIEVNEAYEMLLKQISETDSLVSDHSTEEYDAFIQKVRAAARAQAQMRYKKFTREHEAFQRSGIQDVFLVMKYISRIFSPFLGFGLILFPMIICLQEGSLSPIFYLFFFWVIGLLILWNAYLNRKNYLHLGKFYYSFDRIKMLVTKKNTNAIEKCFYCKNRKADSIPFTLSFLKIKKVRLSNQGPLQHRAGYDRDVYKIHLPRSQYALKFHLIATIIKLLSILGSFFFIPFESIIWRIIAGSVIGFLLSSLVLLIYGVRSKSSYLFSYGILIKIGVWLSLLICLTKFDLAHFNISTSGYIQLYIFCMFFLDAVLEQLLKIPKKRLFKPIFDQYKPFFGYFDKDWALYLEMPVWTTIYPIIVWVF